MLHNRFAVQFDLASGDMKLPKDLRRDVLVDTIVRQDLARASPSAMSQIDAADVPEKPAKPTALAVQEAVFGPRQPSEPSTWAGSALVVIAGEPLNKLATMVLEAMPSPTRYHLCIQRKSVSG
jgi:hypothetical protein